MNSYNNSEHNFFCMNHFVTWARVSAHYTALPTTRPLPTTLLLPTTLPMPTTRPMPTIWPMSTTRSLPTTPTLTTTRTLTTTAKPVLRSPHYKTHACWATSAHQTWHTHACWATSTHQTLHTHACWARCICTPKVTDEIKNCTGQRNF